MNTSTTIRRIGANEGLPLHLLLLADPDEGKVRSYCRRAELWLLETAGQLAGAYVLDHTKGEKTAELCNIAVAPSQQGKGLGKQMIRHATERAREVGAQRLLVGTGNSSISQLAFYQKCGFEMIAIQKGYFLKHYAQPIVEDGIPCRDRILLALPL